MDRLARSPLFLARLAVFFYLLEAAASVFGQIVTPRTLLVTGDGAATANDIAANVTMLRLAFGASLLAAFFHVIVAYLFYELLRPAGRGVALLAAFVLLVGSAIQAAAGLFQAGVLVVVSGGGALAAFTTPQIQALEYLLLDWSDYVFGAFLVFFALWCILVGSLIYRSTFLPRLLGAGMVLAGVAYLPLLYKPLADAVMPLTLGLDAVGELPLIVWLGVVGVNGARWLEQADVTNAAATATNPTAS